MLLINSRQLEHLELILKQFAEWAAVEDQSETGWESEFPLWGQLLKGAEELMQRPSLSQVEVDQIGICWQASEETEDCAGFARTNIHLSAVYHAVTRLTQQSNYDVRWQAYDALGYVSPLDNETRRLLELGMTDGDGYVRRRAFLALMKHPHIKVPNYALQMLNDDEAYNRYVAVLTANQLKIPDPAVEVRAQYLIEHDPEVGQVWARYCAKHETVNTTQ